jgi:TonB family protein
MKRSISVALCALSILILGTAAHAQTETPRTINGGVLNGKAVSLPKPEYSAEAKAAKIQGTVSIQVLIDEQGNVISAEPADLKAVVVRSADGSTQTVEPEPVNPILVEAAQRAAMEAKFSPTLLSGAPVKVRGTITYRFSAMPEVSGGILNGKAVTLPKPVYPPAALAVRAEGAVSVQVTISESGDVESASAVSGHPLLRASAVAAARGAKFSPTILSGNAVKVTGVVIYNFVGPDEGVK